MGFNELRKILTNQIPRRKFGIAVARPDGREIYQAIKSAEVFGIVPIFVGVDRVIEEECARLGFSEYKVLAASGEVEAARKAVELVSSGDADLLMKGSLQTATLMKAVLDDRVGIRGEGLLSHVALFEQPDGRFLGITDGGLNIQPDLEQKIDILHNALLLFRRLGIRKPRVALLSGVEVLNPAIPSTVDAARIAALAVEGQFQEAIVEGPMAFDLAVSPEASKKKRYGGRIKGDADILVTPEIVSGNILGKSLSLAAGFPSGGVVVGARSPIVLLSRSDTKEQKLNSICIALMQIIGESG